MKLLKNLQGRWIKRNDGFENLAYFQILKDLDMFSVEGRLLTADVIKYWKKYFTVNVGYVRTIYYTVLESLMNIFHWIVGGGYLL